MTDICAPILTNNRRRSWYPVVYFIVYGEKMAWKPDEVHIWWSRTIKERQRNTMPTP